MLLYVKPIDLMTFPVLSRFLLDVDDKVCKQFKANIPFLVYDASRVME